MEIANQQGDADPKSSDISGRAEDAPPPAASSGNPVAATVLDVRSMMTPSPVAVAPTTPLQEVIDVMRAREIGSVVVADGPTPVGIFTEGDYLRRCGSIIPLPVSSPICDFMSADLWTVTPETSWQSVLESMQERAIRHAPVVEQQTLVGMLSVRDILRHRTQLLETVVQQRTAELSQQRAILEQRDRERTRSLEIAARIQRRLLPARTPAIDPFQIAFAFHPHDQVAGDYFDIQAIEPDTLLLVIGDASGHGVPAAFISVIAKTCIQTQLSSTTSPAALLEAMNEFLYGWVEPEHFISMFVATVNRRTLNMTYARAGHPHPLLHRRDGSFVELDAAGIMLGVLPDPEFPEETLQLQQGDKMLLYTDGLTECTDAADELFGLRRVQEFLRAHEQTPCRRLVDGLVDEAHRFTGDRGFSDDLTIVLLDATQLHAAES